MNGKFPLIKFRWMSSVFTISRVAAHGQSAAAARPPARFVETFCHTQTHSGHRERTASQRTNNGAQEFALSCARVFLSTGGRFSATKRHDDKSTIIAPLSWQEFVIKLMYASENCIISRAKITREGVKFHKSARAKSMRVNTSRVYFM